MWKRAEAGAVDPLCGERSATRVFTGMLRIVCTLFLAHDAVEILLDLALNSGCFEVGEVQNAWMMSLKFGGKHADVVQEISHAQSVEQIHSRRLLGAFR